MTDRSVCFKEKTAADTKITKSIFEKICVVSLCALFLTFSGCISYPGQKGGGSGTDDSGENASEGVITGEYEMTDEAAVNPYIGFAVDAMSKDAASEYSLVYIDITFRELQPESPDKFDFEAIADKNNIDYWRAEGKHAVLRFVCDIPDDYLTHMDIPDWLYDLTGDGTFYDTSYGKGYSPDYSNEVFMKYHESAVRALGEYFSDGFVSYVELGSLGHWGEWHVKREDGVVGMPEKSVREEYVKHYVSAFDSAKLMMRRPFSETKTYRLGLYNDMAGDPGATKEWLDWIDNGGEYTQTGEVDALSPMPEFWKTAPSGGELTSSLSMDYLCGEGLLQTAELLRQSHTTFIGPKCPVSSSDKYDGEPYVSAVPELIKSVGYRIGITKVKISESESAGNSAASLSGGSSATLSFSGGNGSSLKNSSSLEGDSAVTAGASGQGGAYRIELVWQNDGCAPIYFETPVFLYLTDDSGEQEMIAAIDIDLTELMPGKTICSVTELPGDISYYENKTLSVGLIDPMTGKPAVKLISNQQTNSNLLAELYRFS